MALLLTLVMCVGMIPTAFAAQQNSYHDPAEANNRMRALQAFYCHELKKVMQNLENRGFCITFFVEFIVQ